MSYKNIRKINSKGYVKNYRQMSDYELSRWYSLIEAVNIVAEKCEERNIDFFDDDSIQFKCSQMKNFVNSSNEMIKDQLQILKFKPIF